MGWNGSGQTSSAPAQPKVTAKKPSPVRGLVAGGLVCVLAIGAYFAIHSSGNEKPQTEEAEKELGRIKEVAPAAAPVYKEEAPKEDPETVRRRERMEMLRKLPPEERVNFLLEESKKRPIDFTIPTNHTFATGTEQMMSLIFTTKLGDIPPPMPPMPVRDRAHLAEILIADNPLRETDNERQRAAKEIVTEVKKELREYIKQGGEIDQFFDYYHGQLVQAHNEWTDTQRSVLKVLREDPDIAGEYISEVNERLAQKGIKPVTIPKAFARKYGVELEQPTVTEKAKE